MTSFLLPARLRAFLISARTRAALAALLWTCGAGAMAQAQDPARHTAPADGWAAMAGGTRGGADAVSSRIYTVRDRLQLVSALADGGNLPKIVKVVGVIDMSEGLPTPAVPTSPRAARCDCPPTPR
jgi:pectate lyase